MKFNTSKNTMTMQFFTIYQTIGPSTKYIYVNIIESSYMSRIGLVENKNNIKIM